MDAASEPTAQNDVLTSPAADGDSCLLAASEIGASGWSSDEICQFNSRTSHVIELPEFVTNGFLRVPPRRISVAFNLAVKRTEER